jgi:hypothetical protein
MENTASRRGVTSDDQDRYAACDDFLPDGSFIVALTQKDTHHLQAKRSWSFCTWLMA